MARNGPNLERTNTRICRTSIRLDGLCLCVCGSDAFIRLHSVCLAQYGLPYNKWVTSEWLRQNLPPIIIMHAQKHDDNATREEIAVRTVGKKAKLGLTCQLDRLFIYFIGVVVFFLFAQCDRRRFLLSLLCGVVVSRHHQHPEWIWIVWGIIVLYKWRMSKLVKLGIIRNGGRIMYTTRKGTHDGDGWRWQRIKPSGK